MNFPALYRSGCGSVFGMCKNRFGISKLCKKLPVVSGRFWVPKTWNSKPMQFVLFIFIAQRWANRLQICHNARANGRRLGGTVAEAHSFKFRDEISYGIRKVPHLCSGLHRR